MSDGDHFRESRGVPAWRLMGRLAPGKTLADARAQVEVVAKRLAAAYPAEHKGTRALVIPENRARPDPSLSDYLPVFAAVFAAMVALVLFIACANVANLMLSRAIGRQRDLVIRSALGASRARLVRLQMMEGLVLATLAGIAGLVLARWAGQALAGFTPGGDIPVNQDHPWDWRVYAFTFLASGAAGVVTGLWPAKQASRFNLVESLKEGSSAAGTSRHLLRNLLVVGQVSLSLVVLVSAGLFLHSLRQMQTVALGMRTEHLIMMSVDLGLQQYDETRGRRFLEDLLARTEALPGVTVGDHHRARAARLRHAIQRRRDRRGDSRHEGHIPLGRLHRGRATVPRDDRRRTGARPQPRSHRRRAGPQGRDGERDDGAQALARTGGHRQAVPLRARWRLDGGGRHRPRRQVPDARRRAATVFLRAVVAALPCARHADGADRVRPGNAHDAAAAPAARDGPRPARVQRAHAWMRTCATACSA